MPQVLSRRRLLRGVLAAGATVLAPVRSRAGADKPVIVLGAGLSGLYAALQLRAHGHPVTLIEARRRLGGRVRTLDDVAGRPEGGANIIGPNYGRVLLSARSLGVALDSPGRGESMGLVLGGRRVDRSAWSTSPLNTLPEAIRHVSPDRLAARLLQDNPLTSSWSWRSPAMASRDRAATDHFRDQGIDETALGWIDANNSYGNRLDQTSVLSLFRVQASIGRAIAMKQPVREARDGNQRIPEALARALDRPPVTGSPVVSVKRLGGGELQVSCRDGRAFTADAVISTLPLTALRDVAFHPALPAEQAEASLAVKYHAVTQAHFVAEEPYWKAAGEPAGWWTDGPLGRVFTRQARDGAWNITCWINGEGCLRYDTLPAELARERLREDFSALVPASRGRVRLAKMVAWTRTPWNRGAWAIWRPGQIARYAALLQRPHGRLHFAGEHTAWSNAGMEGAMESGERAALEVMRALA